MTRTFGLCAVFCTLILAMALTNAVQAQDDGQWALPGKDLGATLYVVTPYPNVLYAFDLTQEDYPLKFKYRPDVNPASEGVACCDAVNRGAAYNRLRPHLSLGMKTPEEVHKKTSCEVQLVTLKTVNVF